jgi:hypothetical protein
MESHRKEMVKLKATLALATTEERWDGTKFTHEELLGWSDHINKWGKVEYNREPVPLPYFCGYPNTLRSWVTIPKPGGPAVLFVEGQLEKSFEKAFFAYGSETLKRVMLPFCKDPTGEDWYTTSRGE